MFWLFLAHFFAYKIFSCISTLSGKNKRKHIKAFHEIKKPVTNVKYSIYVITELLIKVCNLSNRIKSIHVGKKTIKILECSKCDFKTSYERALNKHIEVVE